MPFITFDLINRNGRMAVDYDLPDGLPDVVTDSVLVDCYDIVWHSSAPL